jgi:3-isopropylmalate/(R)-2-methylmalate dehydratase small subunit
MRKFERLTAVACPLPIAGIDTDQLIPARFINRTRAEGYGDFLLHDLRQAADFPLNDPAYAGAAVLVARRNFGGGSSREGAVYALLDYGIRCVIAPSFGDIFAGNAVGNGLLPALLAEAEVEVLLEWLAGGRSELTIDLHARTVATPAHVWHFDINPVWREKLLHGWDDLDMTLARQADIDAFVAADRVARAWAWLRKEVVLF